MSRLSVALAWSLLLHLVALTWAVPLSIGHGQGDARSRAPVLRASLNLGNDANALHAQVPISASNSAEPPAEPAKPIPDPARAPVAADAARPEDVRRDPREEGPALPMLGYHPASSLTRMPEAEGVFDIQPPAGGDTGINGKVTIRIWLSAKGHTDSIRMLSSDLPAAYAQAALAAFEALRFRPAEINGTPVGSWMDVVIEYADQARIGGKSPDGGNR